MYHEQNLVPPLLADRGRSIRSPLTNRAYDWRATNTILCFDRCCYEFCLKVRGGLSARTSADLMTAANIFRNVNKRASVDPKKTTCMLYLQADHQFFARYGTEEACIEVMTRHVQRVNAIYRSTGEDGSVFPPSFSVWRPISPPPIVAAPRNCVRRTLSGSLSQSINTIGVPIPLADCFSIRYL